MMDAARNLSPFAPGGNDVPWLLWEKREAVTDLPDMPPAEPAPHPVEPVVFQHETPLPRPVIRRSQYDAVVRRIKHASQQTGTYAAWSP